MPNWVKEKIGNDAYEDWKSIFEGCQKDGRNAGECAATATSIIVSKYNYTPEGEKGLAMRMLSRHMKGAYDAYVKFEQGTESVD